MKGEALEVGTDGEVNTTIGKMETSKNRFTCFRLRSLESEGHATGNFTKISLSRSSGIFCPF